MPKPHPTHKMTKWQGSIITLIATSRFGMIRSCKKCNHEQAYTAAGQGTHHELLRKCNG